MFKIFDRNHKQIDILENPYNAIITDELNGIGELKFTVPITYKKLQLEGYVQVKDGHEYVIKEITTEGRERNVHCVLNIEELLGMVHTTFTSKENNLNDTMKIILNGTTWTHVNNSTRTYTRNLYGTVVSSYHMLQLMSTVFDVEFYFDTHKKIVYIVDRVGEDNGTYFINDLNLKQLSQDTHTHNLITRVIPLGKDNLNIAEVNGGKMWLENHTYSNKIIYGVWQVTDYDNATKLKEDAQRYLNEMAIPYESYEIQVTDISKLANNPDFRYELGDVITIIDNLTETRIKQRIYRKVYNLQDPDADIINIASKDKSFEDYYKRMQTVADMTDKVINTDGTINSEAIDKVPADKIVGDILATGIKADSITADHIKAGQIQAKHITADAVSANHIKANSIQTKHLQANSITSGHIQADTITSSHIQSGAITAGSGIIADGAIGNAQISNLDASKLTAGTIDTSDITIAGANQNLRITGNRLQVFEGVGNKQKERVSLGDVNADGSVYGIRVRGKDGTTVLFDDNGVTKEGITDGSITNDKINPSANIDGSKLNINSVINRINSDGSTNIQGNRISIDNKSLSSVISEINTKNTAQDNTIASQASSITANANAIKLKVDTQAYTTDKTNMTSKLDKATSEISTMKNQIALKVEQTHINNAVNSLNNTIDSKISSAKSEIKATTDSITNRVSKTETNVTNVTNNLNNLQIGGRNLVLNGSFKGNTNWSNWGSPKTREFVSINNKNWCHIVGTGDAQYQGVSQNHYAKGITIETNTQYTFSAKVYGATNNQVFTVGIHWNNDTGIVSQNWKTFTVGTNATIVQHTFTSPSNIDRFNIMVGVNSATTVYNVYFTDIKFEKGNKATDWSPAPEDIQSQIDTNKTNISTTTNKVSEIQTNLNGITSRVSSVETKATTLEGKVTSHDNRIKTAESKITDSAIINTVSSTIDSKVNTGISNIKIGGRNIIKHSAIVNNNATSSYDKSTNTWTITANKGAGGTWGAGLGISGTSVKIPYGETYVLSFEIKVPRNCSWNIDVNNYASGESSWSGNDNDNGSSRATSSKTLTAGQWIKCWSRFSNTHASNTNKVDIYDNSIFGVVMQNETSNMTYYIRNVQGEIGNVATDWTPAPEDVQSQIDTHTTQISTTNNKVSTIETNLSSITSRVSNVETKTTTINNTVTNHESRIKTAESKITETAITNTVKKNFYTKSETDSAITSKGYQTSSQVQQTVDKLAISFKQSGGYNMLRNSDFKRGMAHWSSLRWDTQAGGNHYTTIWLCGHEWAMENRNVICSYVLNIPTSSVNLPLRAGFDSSKFSVQGGQTYTFSCYLAGHRIQGATIEMLCYDASGNRITGNNSMITGVSWGGRNRKNWTKINHHFTTQSNAVSCHVRVFMHEWTGGEQTAYLWMTEPVVCQGGNPVEWSPNPEELTTGITSIDSDGITVSMSNGEGSQGYSKIDYEGLSIYNANGTRKAWFGDDDTAYIANLSADTITNRHLIKWAENAPHTIYVAPTATGDGTGRNSSNKANSVTGALEWYRRTYGNYIYRKDITVDIAGGTYNEHIYIGGFLGSGMINVNFSANAILYGSITVEENTLFTKLVGNGNPWNGSTGAIIESRRNETITVRNCNCLITGFRSRPSQYPNYGSNFVQPQAGARVWIQDCDLVKYWSMATSNACGHLHSMDNAGDLQYGLNQFWSSWAYFSGVYTPMTVGNFLNDTWNSRITCTTNARNSSWIPKNTTPPVVTPTYKWFENTFSLTNLRTVPEGSGSGTSSRSGEWGQGKWSSYKPHRGYANVSGVSSWCSGGRNFSAYLTLTRSSSGHGYAGAVPVPKIKKPDGTFWSCGVAFARGATHTFQLPSEIANALANGSMTTLEMWAGTSTNDYSFYNSGSIKIKCEKQV